MLVLPEKAGMRTLFVRGQDRGFGEMTEPGVRSGEPGHAYGAPRVRKQASCLKPVRQSRNVRSGSKLRLSRLKLCVCFRQVQTSPAADLSTESVGRSVEKNGENLPLFSGVTLNQAVWPGDILA